MGEMLGLRCKIKDSQLKNQMMAINKELQSAVISHKSRGRRGVGHTCLRSSNPSGVIILHTKNQDARPYCKYFRIKDL